MLALKYLVPLHWKKTLAPTLALTSGRNRDIDKNLVSAPVPDLDPSSALALALALVPDPVPAPVPLLQSILRAVERCLRDPMDDVR